MEEIGLLFLDNPARDAAGAGRRFKSLMKHSEFTNHMVAAVCNDS
jgi:hypothetical protein